MNTMNATSHITSALDIIASNMPTKPQYKLFLDTETTGFPKGSRKDPSNYKNLDNFKCARIVQIALLVADENYNTIFEYSRLVRNKWIPDYSTKIHGITAEMTARDGVSIGTVCSVLDDIFAKYGDALCIYAHNAAFDIPIIKSELFRYVATSIRKSSALDALDSGANIICTMEKYKIGGKAAKLSALYAKYVGGELIGAHDAMVDTKALRDCVRVLEGVIIKNTSPKAQILETLNHETLNHETLSQETQIPTLLLEPTKLVAEPTSESLSTQPSVPAAQPLTYQHNEHAEHAEYAEYAEYIDDF